MAALKHIEMQLNLSTMATLGREKSGHCREVLSESMYGCLSAETQKKVAVGEGWPLAEVWL